MTFSLIAAIAEDGCIGKGGKLPWRLPGELQYFKQMTMGKPIIMGRLTFESLGCKPLDGRKNIVVSNTLNPSEFLDVDIVPDFIQAKEKAEKYAKDDGEIMIIGGAKLYYQAMPIVSRMYLTKVSTSVEGGDAYFPNELIKGHEWALVRSKERLCEPEAPNYEMNLYERVG